MQDIGYTTSFFLLHKYLSISIVGLRWQGGGLMGDALSRFESRLAALDVLVEVAITSQIK